jgi:predicted metal-binding membrane protein
MQPVRRRPERNALGAITPAWIAVGRCPERDAVVAIALAWVAVSLAHAGGAAALTLWTVMSAAMMGPAALPAARHVALNSLRRRRRRAVLTFFAGYVAVWLAFGLFALPAVALLDGMAGADVALAGALVAAAVWQLLPYRRRCLRGCRRTVPLRPRGWKAALACLRFSLRYGRSCIGACWPLMLAMALLLHAGLAWMVALAAAAALARTARRPRALAAGFAATAATVLLTAPLAAGAAPHAAPDSPPAWRCVLG